MGKLRAFWMRVLGVLGIGRGFNDAEDFSDELQSHLQMHIDDNLRMGMTAREARRAALLKLGGVAQVTQAYRERHGAPWVEALGQDVRFGLRMLGKNAGFTAVVVLTLGLGIGANTALFSIVDGVLLHPLPYARPDELLTFHASKANFATGSVSWPNFKDWKKENRTLADMAVARPRGFSLTGQGNAERLRGAYISSDFFAVLGVKPALGRWFAEGEDEIGRSPVALIGGGLWARKFGSQPDVIGKPIQLNGRTFTIVGVVPADFDLQVNGFAAGDVYLPVGQWQQPALARRFAGLGFHGIARLKPGVTLEQAQEDLDGLSDRLAVQFPEDDKGIRAKLIPLRQTMVRGVQPVLLVLLGAVGFVLLIACVNVANLMMARANARAQEFAVRSALGAGRMRIVRQLLTESVMLGLMGGALGLLLAQWGTKAALMAVPAGLPRASHIAMNGGVLGFALVVSLMVGVVFGLMPALKMSGRKTGDMTGALKDGGRGMSGGRHRAQGWLVVFEMAMALVLLAGAGLMVRSMIALSEVKPGFDAQGVTTFSLSAPTSMVTASAEEIRAYYREAGRRMHQVPGVTEVSFYDGGLPMTGSDDEELFWLASEPKPANMNDMHWALQYTVEPEYLKAMGIPLLKGRFFTEADDERTPAVVVIDEELAKKYFGNGDPVGKQINLDGSDRQAMVIGVAGHVMQQTLDDDAGFSLRAQIYLPFRQMQDEQLSMGSNLGTDLVVHASRANVMAEIEDALRQMNKEQVVYGVETMNEYMSESLSAKRFSMIVLATFAGLALVLASVGMYGVISYLVNQRTQEIGIRMALGADRNDVLRWVLGQGGRLAMIGTGLGVAGALGLTQVMAKSSMIYGVSAYDPWTLGGVTLLLMLVALVACYVPARRAMRIDPMQALRTE
jgi:predicted permease